MEWGRSLAAGLVCFLSFRETKAYKGNSVPPYGELLPFRILTINSAIKNVVLTGPHAQVETGQTKVWDKTEPRFDKVGENFTGEISGEVRARPFWRKKPLTSLSSSEDVTDVQNANDARETPGESAEDEG